MDKYLNWLIAGKKLVEVMVDENFKSEDLQTAMLPVYELYIECYSPVGITFRDDNGVICWYPMDRIIKIESYNEILVK